MKIMLAYSWKTLVIFYDQDLHQRKTRGFNSMQLTKIPLSLTQLTNIINILIEICFHLCLVIK